MGGQTSRQKKTPPPYNVPKATLTPEGTNLGPEFCRSCWFERKGLVECHNHYLCMSCLTLLLTVSDRCPICKFPLPTRLELKSPPTAPPNEEDRPPAYTP
ncbi:Z protein [Kwanza virus]|uniref:RING finger protein Z n=1 Tax=Kwanza virus TaxID=3070923 RepID=A0A8F1SYA6_9VIRU|nr:Z protein [Kwanza virus]QWQ58026.1 Z protein [Kwanza virus]